MLDTDNLHAIFKPIIGSLRRVFLSSGRVPKCTWKSAPIIGFVMSADTKRYTKLRLKPQFNDRIIQPLVFFLGPFTSVRL